MTQLTTAQVSRKLDELLKSIDQSHEPVQINGKRSKGVLIAESDWRAIQETLYLVSIPGMRASIRRGLKISVSRCSEDPGW